MEPNFSQSDIDKLNSSKGILSLFNTIPFNVEKALRYIEYKKELKKLQVELIRMQTWAIDKNKRIIIIFEGRDAAGKGGAIRRITERLNPRYYFEVALPKPSVEEQGQWYFQRYLTEFPKAGEIVLFDRSWYNRAVVEPVNGFCTDHQYNIFMNQVNEFERMIVESDIQIVKIYMSISKDEQARRFEDIKTSLLKQWKITPVDEKAQELWDQYTFYKREMFSKTSTALVPWKVIKANRKTTARINAIKYILSVIPYDKNLKI
ncbi:MAG: polyphosphate kinase 2 [Zetaproteobacteria bacterium]|nr:polyphosphate kinase 2 [Zetaproteobacteria bacterium]OIO10870.1 MAG: polyphosphate kinase 2 [Flavobacteriaceae bacterium CG1_02_35_72]PIR12895.1 MAG: polyphosphate kinase 2 [Flavobacteriales bacterium CG11_big_fil_rev_8_21_14_0_20_35_7]PJA05616.1 MAG: polyphosphate kinase 2 [Flavobacteriales bacterium CG_4_10_14_0_2_um_filter_35_18]